MPAQNVAEVPHAAPPDPTLGQRRNQAAPPDVNMNQICLSCSMPCSFFFQAEDGIRDIGVTGVQTCALPIWRRAQPNQRGLALDPAVTCGIRRPYTAWEELCHPSVVFFAVFCRNAHKSGLRARVSASA